MLTNYNQTGSDMTQTRDFVTITFRLDKQVIDNFRGQSEKSGISVNALVNQVLRNYIEWDVFEPRVGVIPFPKAVLANIYAEMNADQVARLASNIGKNTAIDMAIFMKGRIDVLDFVSWLEMRMRNSGFEIIHRVDGTKGVHSVTIKHDLGKNWSLYLKIMMESVLADFFKKRSEFVVSDSMLLANFNI